MQALTLTRPDTPQALAYGIQTQAIADSIRTLNGDEKTPFRMTFEQSASPSKLILYAHPTDPHSGLNGFSGIAEFLSKPRGSVRMPFICLSGTTPEFKADICLSDANWDERLKDSLRSWQLKQSMAQSVTLGTPAAP